MHAPCFALSRVATSMAVVVAWGAPPPPAVLVVAAAVVAAVAAFRTTGRRGLIVARVPLLPIYAGVPVDELEAPSPSLDETVRTPAPRATAPWEVRDCSAGNLHAAPSLASVQGGVAGRSSCQHALRVAVLPVAAAEGLAHCVAVQVVA